MVMELCEGGGILDRIKDRPFTEKRVAYIIRSILRFVAQCHAKGALTSAHSSHAHVHHYVSAE